MILNKGKYDCHSAYLIGPIYGLCYNGLCYSFNSDKTKCPETYTHNGNRLCVSTFIDPT